MGHIIGSLFLVLRYRVLWCRKVLFKVDSDTVDDGCHKFDLFRVRIFFDDA